MNPSPGSNQTQDPRHIVVRGVNWLGDAVMTTPALLRLRERFPNSRICLLTPEKLKDLWSHHQAVNEVLTLSPGESPLAVGRKLRSHRFDLGLILPNSPRSAFELWLARLPRRVGFARPWRNWCLTERVSEPAGFAPMRKRTTGEIQRLISKAPQSRDTPGPALSSNQPGLHHIHHYLHLTAALGANPQPLAPQLTVTTDEIEDAIRKFNLAPGMGSHQPLLAVNAGAEYGPAKRWPIERFVAATRQIASRIKCTWLILGGAGDVGIANQIMMGLQSHESPVCNLAGQTSLRELCALLKQCRVLLTNDTGPMHVAAALGIPVVALFGSTSPELTAPGLPGDPRHCLLRSDAPCSPCFRTECPIDFRCMKEISVERVVNAVMAALA